MKNRMNLVFFTEFSNVCYIFDQELFKFWDLLQKRMPGASERAFVSGLEDFSVTRGRVRKISYMNIQVLQCPIFHAIFVHGIEHVLSFEFYVPLGMGVGWY